MLLRLTSTTALLGLLAAAAPLVGPAGAFTVSPRGTLSASRASFSSSAPPSAVRLWASSADEEVGGGATATKEAEAESGGGGGGGGGNAVLTEARQEADDALASVGWSSPLQDAEMTSDDPFVRKIDESIKADVGVGLDELLNPAKVVNLERDLYNLRSELAYLTGKGGNLDVEGLTTAECDGGGGGEEADAIRKSIDKKERDLLIERRAVFRGWLKNVFLGQAVLSLGLSWIMVSNPASLFGGYDWFNTLNLDISIRVLGFWWWWLFIVPSLRSRRPKGFEKKALDLAFLGTPLISLVAPALTKDTELIWFANLAVCVAAYGFAFITDGDEEDGGGGGGGDDKNQPEWLKFVYKSLDFGSGRERGARN